MFLRTKTISCTESVPPQKVTCRLLWIPCRVKNYIYCLFVGGISFYFVVKPIKVCFRECTMYLQRIKCQSASVSLLIVKSAWRWFNVQSKTEVLRGKYRHCFGDTKSIGKVIRLVKRWSHCFVLFFCCSLSTFIAAVNLWFESWRT